MQPIIDFFSRIFEYILDAFSYCLNWVLDLLTTAFDTLLNPIAQALPDLSSYWSQSSVLADYLPVVNFFFPLYEAGFFIVTYFTFLFVFLVAKYVIKIFVPFVG